MGLNKAKDLAGMRGFDVDLKYGKHFEELIDDIFSGVYQAEVKTERDKWVGYGNMVVEVAYKGSPSGLSTTTSDVWVHCFAAKGELVFALMIPSDVLREIVRKMEEDGVSRNTNGGDGWKSNLELLPIEKVVGYLREYGKGVLNGGE